METSSIHSRVEQAQRRLARICARTNLRKHGMWVLLAGCAIALARPLLWPLSAEDPVYMGAPRALLLILAALVVGWVALYLIFRRRPSQLHAARRIDSRLELREVVASGWALQGTTPEEELARAHADQALINVDVPKLFPLPRLRPRWRSLALGLFALVLVTLGGSYDPALARILTSPPTVAELDGAAELADAAAELEEREQRETEINEPEPGAERTPESDRPNTESLAQQASDIARDLGRGDREGALQKLRSMRDQAHERRDQNRQLDRAARRMAEHLDASRRTPANPSSSSSRESNEGRREADESMSLLSRRMRDPQSAENTNAQERQRTLERLSRAADEARRSGSRHGEQLAEALSRAADAMNRGAMEEAARRMEEAAARSAQLQAERERMQAQAEALARLLERAGMLERDVQLAMMGREGQQGQMMMGQEGQGQGQQGEGDGRRGLAEGLAARLAAMGLAEQPGRAGGRDGGGPGSRRPGRVREGLDTHGDVHARSQVREGERAVQILEGLGRNGEAETQYSDVYPSYGAIAEDALASEDVPAARREAVRRYFEMIRPDSRLGEREEIGEREEDATQ